MLYLLFFLLRDGAALTTRIRDAIPLSAGHKRHLFKKFTTVIRATVKGNVAVAASWTAPASPDRMDPATTGCGIWRCCRSCRTSASPLRVTVPG